MHVFFFSCLLHHYRVAAKGEVGEEGLGMRLPNKFTYIQEPVHYITHLVYC